jgi:hypothetical protein
MPTRYAAALKKVSDLAKNGQSDDQLYEVVVRMQAKGKLPASSAPWKIVLDALKIAQVNRGTYNNANLRRQPRRLIFDTHPTLAENLSKKDRAAMYRNASQICNNSIGRNYIRSVLQNDKAHVFFSRNADQTIVSFVIVDPTWQGSNASVSLRIAEIDLICAQRGRGMELMKSIIEYYDGLKYDIVRLEAVEGAIKAYHKFGFEAVGYNDEDLFVMFYMLADRVFMPTRKLHEYLLSE